MIPKLETNDDFVQVDIPIVVSISVPKDNQYDLESYQASLKRMLDTTNNLGWEEEECFQEVDDVAVTSLVKVIDPDVELFVPKQD